MQAPKALNVAIDFAPLPLPFPVAGLAFQMGEDPSRAMRTKPIGDALLDEDGTIYFSFPLHNLVARYGAGPLNSSFLGSKRMGGKGEPLLLPERLGISAGWLYVTAKQHGEVMAFDGKGELVLQLKLDYAGLFPCNGGRLLAQGLLPGSWDLLDNQGERIGEFQFPGSGKNMLLSMDERGVLAVLDQDSHLLFFASLNAPIRVFQLGLKLVKARASHLVYSKGRFWIMLQATHRSCLLVLDELGTIRHYWFLEHDADGVSVSEKQLLFFHRASGSAQSYRRL